MDAVLVSHLTLPLLISKMFSLFCSLAIQFKISGIQKCLLALTTDVPIPFFYSRYQFQYLRFGQRSIQSTNPTSVKKKCRIADMLPAPSDSRDINFFFAALNIVVVSGSIAQLPMLAFREVRNNLFSGA